MQKTKSESLLKRVKETQTEPTKAFQRLLFVMDDLRQNCPWDKKQTLESLRYLTIEEVYELSDAILSKDNRNGKQEIKKELGDVMLHLVFYSKIASETNDFDITDVLNSVCEKLIHRHPHIYSNIIAETEAEVKQNWERIKLEEKSSSDTKIKSLFEGVPKSMPALVKAIRIQQKARGVGFDWDKASDVWDKVKEEETELFEHIDTSDDTIHKVTNQEEAENEFGDLLFSMINYARFLGINPENALEKTNRKFISRFEFLETEAHKDGKKIENMTLAEMEAYWQKAKKNNQ
ncbi:MazG family protein [Bernardetia litoralis DSM 6794]|uniref:Nucleoside triphosphate pyrophosphohydrolase n=1 Tax=Bernardetia litoralis (strain ATCC 23117 / DSM 6794 / NBRC 15988 / NCIMB 1366 / Fx l1 / Sio-4) TaxID=880071 RepID=I4AIZ6_BERLS|nr:nucleoside triphosphate pyrophosphohydrolase [Bernardetia litoralis]AFM03931.1 MazG family protein [Bernardetia litoralis DSM 6794]